jgi:hypothetical protein
MLSDVETGGAILGAGPVGFDAELPEVEAFLASG